ASCGTKRAMRSTTPISCAAGRRASGSSARPPLRIPSTTRRSRTAKASSIISITGTRRAIPTRTSPRRSRSGWIRTRCGRRGTRDDRQLYRQLSVHDRSAAPQNHRTLPRAEPAADGFGGIDQGGLHGLPHGPDDELPAQRTASGGVVSVKLRVLALVHRHLIPPAALEEGADIESAPWRTEYDVISTLTAMGHEVHALGVHDDLGDIRRAATEWKPHIAFNLLEAFDDITIFDQNVVSHLELLKLPYTGCNPRGLLLARDKSLSK